jgi:hypothetical protein
MKSAVWSGVLAVALLSVPVRPAAAQDPPFERIQLTKIVVKPGMMDAFEAGVKQLNEARAKAKDPAARSVWQVGRGGPPRTFYSVLRFSKWGELESLMQNRDVFAKAFGEREGLRAGDALSETIESGETHVLTVWKGMNAWKDGTWGYAWVTDSNVRPGAWPRRRRPPARPPRSATGRSSGRAPGSSPRASSTSGATSTAGPS